MQRGDAMKEQTVQLNSGQRMPLLGLGTYALQGRVAEEAILQAVDLGYRLFDTAQMYANEKEVGRALRACGLSRQDLFVTSKIYRPDLSCARARAAIERSLDRLQMDYLDLMLIHEPYAEAEEMYQALEEAFQAGKIRSIGVSNFSVARFTKFLSGCSIVPAVNQVEVHVFYQQGALHRLLAGQDVHMQAWSPLTAGRAQLAGNEVLRHIAERHGRTPCQVALRFLVEQGISVIPKASSRPHLQENLAVLDFSLDGQDMASLRALDRGRTLFGWY